MDITIGKLTTGEIVIGKLSYTGDLSESLIIHIMPSQHDGGLQVGLAPIFAPLCSDLIEIPKTALLFTHIAPIDLKSEYLKLTTGLITPNSKEASNILQMTSKQPILK